MSGNQSAVIGIQQLDYQVYSAFIEEYIVRDRGFDRGTLVICADSDNTDAGVPVFEEVKRKLFDYEITDDLIDSFRQRNQSQHKFDRNFRISLGYELVSKSELDKIRDGKVGFEAEQKLMQRFPNHGWPIYFSAIGYNSDMKRAVFFFAHSFIETRYIVMTLENGRWKIEVNRQSAIV